MRYIGSMLRDSESSSLLKASLGGSDSTKSTRFKRGYCASSARKSSALKAQYSPVELGCRNLISIDVSCVGGMERIVFSRLETDVAIGGLGGKPITNSRNEVLVAKLSEWLSTSVTMARVSIHRLPLTNGTCLRSPRVELPRKTDRNSA